MTNPTLADFKAYFTRDFQYGSQGGDYVSDADVSKAITKAAVFIPASLFSDQESYWNAFLLLAAHFLVMDVRRFTAGSAGRAAFLQQSKSVGSVSESFAIPEWILQNPVLMQLAQTNYGNEYLFFIMPYLTGQIFTVEGWTNA